MKLTKNKSVFLRRRNSHYLFKHPNLDHLDPKGWQQAMHQYSVDYADDFKPGCLVSDAGSKKSMGMIIGPMEKHKVRMHMRDGGSFMRTKYYVRVRWMYDHGTAIDYVSDETMDIIYLSRFRPWRGFYKQKESALQAEPKSV